MAMAAKVALVTGSSDLAGIGFGIARVLACKGCSVVLTGSREPEKVEASRKDLNERYNVPVHYFSANLTDTNSIEKLYGSIKQAIPGGVDILVNNAGYIHLPTPVESLSMDTWNKSLQINVTAPLKLIQLVLPEMKRKGWGRIVNISSIFGMGSHAGGADYVSSKHGLNGLTKTVALETAGSGVTCNAVCPSAVNSSTFKTTCEELSKMRGIPCKDFEKMILTSSNPSGQLVEVEQIGELVAFLCSSAGDQMTGSIIPIDGGNRAK